MKLIAVFMLLFEIIHINGFPQVSNVDLSNIFEYGEDVQFDQDDYEYYDEYGNLGVKITDGEESTPNSWPWAATITWKSNGRVLCGGSLIEPRHILTAAHCLNPETNVINDWKDMEILLGAHDVSKDENSRQSFNIVKAKRHESYITESPRPPFLNDIAILTLDRTPIINEFVSYAPLSKSTKWNEDVGLKATVVGWGLTKNVQNSASNVLLETQVTIKSAQECKDDFYTERSPKDSFICTKLSREDSCQGDSGGPLNCPISDTNVDEYDSLEVKTGISRGNGSENFVVCGIVSFGKKGACGGTSGNAYPIYTNVAFYRDWIAKNTVLDGAPQCKTRPDSSKNPNKVCLFPFIFRGTTYTKCADLTTDFDILKNVCATEYGDGMNIKSYGTCSEACEEIGKPKTCKTDAKETLFNPRPDQECIFPFSYEGKRYQKCSTISIAGLNLNNICATKTQGKDNELLEFGVCSKACDKIGTDDITSQNVKGKSILVAGGYDGSSFSSVEVLSSESSMSNKELAALPNGIDGSPSLFLDGDNLLLCGGSGNENKCLIYEDDSWKEHSNLQQGRRYASAVTTADWTFIFGGESDDWSERTFDYLSKNSKSWKENTIVSLPQGNFSERKQTLFISGCAVKVPKNETVILIGGSYTEKRILKFLIGVHFFIEMDVSLIKARRSHSCARLPDTNLIVITGGLDSDVNSQDTSEILNLEDNTITLGNPMNTKRWGHGMAVITIDNEDRLAVFGGKDENGDYLDSVETLNPRTRKWEISDLKLNEAKRGFGYISLPNDFISNL